MDWGTSNQASLPLQRLLLIIFVQVDGEAQCARPGYTIHLPFD